MTLRVIRPGTLALAAVGALSCTGAIATGPQAPGDDGTGAPRPGDTGPGALASGTPGRPAVPPPPAMCGGGLAAARPAVRRLTRSEYDATVRDLLGATTSPAQNFVQDDQQEGLDNNGQSPVGATLARQYAAAAESLAATATATRLAQLLPCTPAAGEDACAAQFVRAFGKRAYRRPLTDVEAQRLVDLYRATRARKQDFTAGVRILLTAMLQSPSFVNHVERGVAARGSATVVALTPHEIASRLSYFLWGTMPDDALFAAADSGELATPAGIEAQVTRMLGGANQTRARAGLLSFFQQWLELRRLDDGFGNGPSKDAKVYPTWSGALRQQMRQETEAFISDVLWNGDGKLTTLLTAPFSFVNDKLATLYDVGGVTGAAMVRRDLDPSRRSGLLTQAGFLALRSYSVLTDPVHRGLFVRERLLCQHMPSPPTTGPDGQPLVITPPQRDPTKTTRDLYTRISEDAFCGGCHRLLNPPGLAFEGYDAIGRYRATDNGQPVDASGQMLQTRDLDGPFPGILDLSGKLARSQEVRDCVAGTLLAYATGTSVADLACEVQKLGAAFSSADTDLRKLMVAIAKSDPFRHRRPMTTEVCP